MKKLIFFLLPVIALGCCGFGEIELTPNESLAAMVSDGIGITKTQRIEQFKHSTRLRDQFKEIYCTDNEIMETHLFGPGLLYDLGEDRADWNKLGGWYFNNYQPHGESVMIGFRTDVERGVIEYTFYYHNISNTDKYKAVGSVPGYVDESNILTIEWDDNQNASTYTKTTIKILDSKRIEMRLEDYEGNAIQDTVSFPKVRSNFTRGNLYHGGNRKAQDKITAVKMIY